MSAVMTKNDDDVDDDDDDDDEDDDDNEDKAVLSVSARLMTRQLLI